MPEPDYDPDKAPTYQLDEVLSSRADYDPVKSNYSFNEVISGKADDLVEGTAKEKRVREQDKIRENLAYWILRIFSGILLVGPAVLFVMYLKPTQGGAIKDLYFAVFTAMIGVVGGVLGYYYGKDKDS